MYTLYTPARQNIMTFPHHRTCKWVGYKHVVPTVDVKSRKELCTVTGLLQGPRWTITISRRIHTICVEKNRKRKHRKFNIVWIIRTRTAEVGGGGELVCSETQLGAEESELYVVNYTAVALASSIINPSSFSPSLCSSD